MNRVLNLLTCSFALFGIITAVLFFLSDLNTIRYVQISIMGFFLFDALREFAAEHRRKNIILYKSILAIFIITIMIFVLLNNR
ncbi:MAG: hypothetical protein AB2375_02590 [Tissierellaceae bacterium]|jgi:hypothetical protein